MAEKRFPILGHETIKSIPWDVVEPHRRQAMENHGQTLERLAVRGGLDLAEVVAVIADRDWNSIFRPAPPDKEPET